MYIAGFFRASTLHFVKKVHEHDDVYSFYFTSRRTLKHLAGQHGVFILHNFTRPHIFSLSSAPDEKYVMITTHVRNESKYKQALLHLEKGDKLTLVGPVLNFVFQSNPASYVFLAQGIGITPFRSMLVANNHKLPVTLIHVAQPPHTFRGTTEKTAQLAHYPSNTQEFTQAVKKQAPGSHYYISGSLAFVKSTQKLLKEQGVKKSHTHADRFLGY